VYFHKVWVRHNCTERSSQGVRPDIGFSRALLDGVAARSEFKTPTLNFVVLRAFTIVERKRHRPLICNHWSAGEQQSCSIFELLRLQQSLLFLLLGNGAHCYAVEDHRAPWLGQRDRYRYIRSSHSTTKGTFSSIECTADFCMSSFKILKSFKSRATKGNKVVRFKSWVLSQNPVSLNAY